MRFTSMLCAVALMTPVPGLCQISPAGEVPVAAGSRVRIASPLFGGAKQIGTVVSVSRDTLILRQGIAAVDRSIATSDVAAVDVSKGMHSRKAKGALWGLLIGAGAGAVIGYATYKDPPPCADPSFCWNLNFGPSSKESNAVFAGALVGILGSLVGTIVGAHETEAWVPGTVGAR